jgi:hypothetical protein
LEEEKKKSINIEADAESFADEVASNLLDTLYASGFGSFEEVGILVPRGVKGDDILVTTKNGVYRGYKSYDATREETSPKKFTILGKESDEKKLGILQERFTNLSSTLAERMTLVNKSINADNFNDSICDTQLLPETLELFEQSYLARLHACLQKADARAATGIISRQRWLTQKIKEGGEEADHYQQLKNIINSGKTKLTTYSDVKDWYKWCLKNIYYKYAGEGVADRDSINILITKPQVKAYKEKLLNGIGKVAVVTSCSNISYFRTTMRTNFCSHTLRSLYTFNKF